MNAAGSLVILCPRRPFCCISLLQKQYRGWSAVSINAPFGWFAVIVLVLTIA